jgi:hypothetical protein
MEPMEPTFKPLYERIGPDIRLYKPVSGVYCILLPLPMYSWITRYVCVRFGVIGNVGGAIHQTTIQS